ncbi:MAG TPA: hypothetical protein VGM14_18075, partial [Streptosporangiaceae bacterium]
MTKRSSVWANTGSTVGGRQSADRTAAQAEFGEFGEFASAQAGQLFRIAYLLCGNWHEAEDLVQT